MDTIGVVDAPLTGGVILISISVLALAVLLFAIGRASGQFQARRVNAIGEADSDYWRVLLSDYYLNALPQATAGYWCGLLLALGAAGLGVWLLLSSSAGQWTVLADGIVGVMALILLELSNGSRRLMLAMIGAAQGDRKFGESIVLAGQTEGHVKQRLLAILSLHFAGVKPGTLDGGVVKDTLWGAQPVKPQISGASSRCKRRCKKKKSKSHRLCRVIC